MLAYMPIYSPRYILAYLAAFFSLSMTRQSSTRLASVLGTTFTRICVSAKGEHECTHGWPRSIPTGLQAFKIQTQIQASNRVQVTWICGSSTCKNTSTCHLIKKSDTSQIQTGDLTFKAVDALDHWAIYTWDGWNIKPAYTKSSRKLKYILYKGFRHSISVWS